MKTPESAGLAMFQQNRRLTNHDRRISKVGIRDGLLYFDILRLGILRFCGFVGSYPEALPQALLRNPYGVG